VTALTATHRQQIDPAKEQLVARAEKLLDEVDLKNVDRDDFGHSQLRNLSAVAAETQSPAVVANFLRFQIGRDKKGQNWAKRVGTKRLGEVFLDALGAETEVLPGLARQIAGAGAPPLTVQLVRMELIRHFLGFAGRYLKFLDLERPKKGRGQGDTP
jgi:hypothetical protein